MSVVSVEQVDRGAVAGRCVVEGLMSDLDAVAVDDPHGEGVLVGGRFPRLAVSCCAPGRSDVPVGPGSAGALGHNRVETSKGPLGPGSGSGGCVRCLDGLV